MDNNIITNGNFLNKRISDLAVIITNLVKNYASSPIIQSTIATSVSNAVTNALVANGTLHNSVINGDMRIAQRGTSGALTSTPGSYPSVDRWVAYQGGSANGTASQIASGLTGFQYALKVGRNNAATTTGDIWIGQGFETGNSIPLQGQTVTFSFYAKAGTNFSGTVLRAALVSGTGTGQSMALVPASGWTGFATPINTNAILTTTWQRFTYSGTIPSTATQLAVVFAYTPLGIAGVDDNVYITGVQLEQGSVASPFEIRLYQSELALCQRYYYKISSSVSAYVNAGSGIAYSTTNGQVFFTLPEPMRTLPTGSYSALTNWNSFNLVNSGLPTVISPVSSISSDYRIVTINLASTYTVGQAIALNANNTFSAWIAWNAEL